MRAFLAAVMALALAGCLGPPGGLPDAEALGKPDRYFDAKLGVPGKERSVRIAAHIRGDPVGRPLIFVHGTPGSASVWTDMMAAGDGRFMMIAIDRPGFGDSEPETAVTSLADQARALLPILEKHAGRKPILIGHSLGGPIVAKAAAMYPDLVGGLVIAAGAFDPALEKIYALQYLGESFLLRWALPRTLRNANRELIALEPELEELAGALGGIQVPVAIVHGTKDKQVPYENVGFLTARLKGAAVPRLTRIEGGNHFLPWNGIAELWQAIDSIDAAIAEQERVQDGEGDDRRSSVTKE